MVWAHAKSSRQRQGIVTKRSQEAFSVASPMQHSATVNNKNYLLALSLTLRDAIIHMLMFAVSSPWSR